MTTDVSAPADNAMPASGDPLQIFLDHSEGCDAIQRKIIEVQAYPGHAKSLRLFPTSEAARLIRISESHLRALLKNEQFPQGTVIGGNNRRGFTLAEVNQIRRQLFQQTGDVRYRVGRDREAGEKLSVITVANFKGGAAKTTHSVHLAQYLALQGYRVLMIDLDSQASATSLFGFVPDEQFDRLDTLYRLFTLDDSQRINDLRPLVQKTYWDGLDVIPANLGLYSTEFEVPVRQMRQRELRFWRILQDALPSIDQDYDIIVCDCPPSLSYLSINAVMAANFLLIPIPPSMLDFSSAGRFFRMVYETLSTLAQAEGGRVKTFDAVRLLVSKYQTADGNQSQLVKWMGSIFADTLLENRMALTTGLDSAGNLKQSYYELEASDVNRRTYERGLEYLNNVNAEIERVIWDIWKRTPAREGTR
ncbi:plasmid partitioning protein RepA [Nitrospirillum sp. BR 11164]|uniref:plasmid partitioning protein RepA n=1 Tax=Nitrospirillum sp. BR 11164 TaxID=3104324 RepID=UPI002AFDEE01|nr:plasmid partitioning protein RepA [Nitrospirillum sp. BR 11164]MEA1653129.1 plasmid partitioning protein RepA [Nitrospirillum sp. BR 11164]